MIPYPYAKALYIWGAPIWVEADSSRDTLERKRLELEQSLNQITRTADETVSQENI